MKILRNYILKDFFSALVFSLLIFTTVMLVGNLMKLSDMVIRKGVDLFDALKIFSFFLPVLLKYTLPLSFLLGVLLSMGRLISDNEIVAINVAGISFFKILRVFLVLGIISSLGLFVLNDRIIPGFHYKYRSQIKSIYSKNINALIEPGVFLEHFENYVLYVADREENKLKNVFIYEVEDGAQTSKVTFAKRGEFVAEKNILKMKLEEGFRDETSGKNSKELYRLNFKVFFMDIPIEEEKQTEISKKPKDMTLKELHAKIDHFKKINIDPIKLQGEFHKRISFSLSILIFIVLGFGISLSVRHREKSINFGIAFFTAGFYYLLFILGEALFEYGIVAPVVGMWIPNVVMSIPAIYLIFKNAHFR